MCVLIAVNYKLDFRKIWCDFVINSILIWDFIRLILFKIEILLVISYLIGFMLQRADFVRN